MRPDAGTPTGAADPALWQVAGKSGALLASLLLLMMGAGLQSSLLGVRAADAGFPLAVTGFVLSAYYGGYLVGSWWGPELIRQVGHIRAFAGLASLASAAVLVHGVWPSPLPWFGLRFLTGVCLAGVYIVSESWLNAVSTPATRGQLLGLYTAVLSGGLALGQTMLNIPDPGGLRLFVAASVLVSLAVVPCSLSPLPGPAVTEPAPYPWRALVADAPLAMAGALAAGFGVGALVGFGAVYAGRIGFSLAEVSLFMAAVPIGSVVVQYPAGRLSDALDRRIVLAGLCLVAAVVAVTGCFQTNDAHPGLVAGVAGIVGGSMFALYSLSLAHLNDFIEPGEVVAAGARMVFLNGIGAATGPVVVSAAVSATTAAAYFLILATVLLITGAYALWRLTRRSAPPANERSEFHSMLPPSITPVFSDLVELDVADAAERADG